MDNAVQTLAHELLQEMTSLISILESAVSTPTLSPIDSTGIQKIYERVECLQELFERPPDIIDEDPKLQQLASLINDRLQAIKATLKARGIIH